MSKKKSTKPSSKSTKAASSKKAKKPADPPAEASAEAQTEVTSATIGDCPKGGDHEWTDEAGENFCSKCKEPKEAKAAKPKRQRMAKQPGEKKLSAIDAAAQLLADVGTPMNCQEIVEAMASKGLWESPGGKTPHATLYSAIIREIGLKGDAARFVKAERGRFAIKA